MGRFWWKVIAIVSILGISISLYRLCLSSSSLQHASIGGTILYVVMFLMLHFPTTIRIYKEHEPFLPGTRKLFSLIPMTAIYYTSFNYPTVDVLLYIYSMFAFGFAMFQLNSPMQFQHARCTLIFAFYIGFCGLLFGQFCSTVSCPVVPSFFWIYFHAKILANINGIFV